MEEQSFYYRRNLPHYQPENGTYFVTFRLAGSLPQDAVIKLKEEYDLLQRKLSAIQDDDQKGKMLADERRRYFDRFDEFLDKHTAGPNWLSDPGIAQLVAQAIRCRDGIEYDLIAYCIMPNHVHLVIEIVERTSVRCIAARAEAHAAQNNLYALTKILRLIKGSTSRESNKLLQRTGKFWQHESYDHVVRSGKELVKIVGYVLNNPVKAGLVLRWEDWRWNYYKYET